MTLFTHHLRVNAQKGGGCTLYNGLYRKAPLERGAVFKLAVYLRVGKIVVLVYERVTKWAAKWKRWQLKADFGRNDKMKHIKACTL